MHETTKDKEACQSIIMERRKLSFLRYDNEIFLPIKTCIESCDADIIILTHAEVYPKDESDVFCQFPKYHIHHKFIPGATRAKADDVGQE